MFTKLLLQEVYYGMGIYRYDFDHDIYYGHGGYWGSLAAYCPEKKVVICENINQAFAPYTKEKFTAELLRIFKTVLLESET